MGTLEYIVVPASLIGEPTYVQKWHVDPVPHCNDVSKNWIEVEIRCPMVHRPEAIVAALRILADEIEKNQSQAAWKTP